MNEPDDRPPWAIVIILCVILGAGIVYGFTWWFFLS